MCPESDILLLALGCFIWLCLCYKILHFSVGPDFYLTLNGINTSWLYYCQSKAILSHSNYPFLIMINGQDIWSLNRLHTLYVIV